MLLKEFYQSMYGKIIVENIDDETPVKYKQDGEDKEMSAKAAKRMSKDHPAKIAYDAMVKDGGSAAKKSVNIFDKPADEPKSDKPKPSRDDAKQIGGPNGLELDRDDIARTLMNDPEIAAILGDEDDVYWDDVDLVSSKWDDDTIASIDPDSPETIGDLKQRIKDYAANNDSDEDSEYEIDDLRNEIEDLTMEIEEYDKAIEDAKREYEEAMEMGDYDEAEYARDMLSDMRAEKNGAIAILKQKQSQLKDSEAEQGEKQAARDNQEFEPVENDKDINRMQQGIQQAIGGDDYEDVPDRLELQGKMKADNGETIIVWKDTDDGMMMGVDAEGNVYEDGEKARYGIGVSTAGNVFGADQNKQRKAENIVPTGTFRRIQENYIKKNL